MLLQTQSHENPLYSGMVDATKKTIKAEGLSGLYKGVASPLAGSCDCVARHDHFESSSQSTPRARLWAFLDWSTMALHFIW